MFWICGRRVHRVVTEDRTYFSIPVELIFNKHPEVARSALITTSDSGTICPGIVIERFDKRTKFAMTEGEQVLFDLREWASKYEDTRQIKKFYFSKDLDSHGIKYLMNFIMPGTVLVHFN